MNSKETQILEIAKKISRCKKCSLFSNRKNTVPGEGNPDSKIMLIGQAPGKQEDITGRPFIGKSGQLLSKALNAVGIRREDIFITSINKCYPPNDRKPKANEIKACLNYLEDQIKIIKPEIIILLGNVAIKSILKINKPLKDIRGKIIDINNIKYLPTFHPAAVLRNMNRFKDFIEDLKIYYKS